MKGRKRDESEYVTKFVGIIVTIISECSGRPVFIFFIKENWICAMVTHHAEPHITVLLTRNLPFDSDSDSAAIL